MNRPMPSQFHQLLSDIKQRVRTAQYDALKAVNKELIALYWDVGRLIICRQSGHSWGKSVVARLARDLQAEFPGIGGLSVANLWRMKSFYKTYQAFPKLAPLVREIGWTHNVLIMEKCKDSLEREFYIRMARKFGWSKSVLVHQIDSKTYDKILLNQTNFDKVAPAKIRNQAKLAVKDDYIFDFLELGEEHTEREFERAILSKIEAFLREMGGLFAFLASQYRLEVEGEEYFIDLLLYHRTLKSLVAIELKIGKFLPEFVGKMQFYLAVLDDKVRLPDENSSIGIILCRNKNKTIVEYALRESKKPIAVAAYKIVHHLPQPLKGLLPEPSQIARLLKNIQPLRYI